MKITLFENNAIADLFPIAMTRHVAEIRWGKQTIQEKWNQFFEEVALHSDSEYLGLSADRSGLWVLGNIVPNQDLVMSIKQLLPGQSLFQGNELLAFHSNLNEANEVVQCMVPFVKLKQLSDLFSLLGEIIVGDYDNLNANDFHHDLPAGVTIIGDSSQLMIAKNAKIQPGSILNCAEGPIFIDEHAEVMEGSMVRGPFYLGKKATLKMGTKVYGPSAIGPECKVGGEVSNVLFLGYSNKAHDGFLGNSVIGEWCNLGADTNNSNLKNNYGNVKIYSYAQQKMVDTGLQFCGLIMGDHSKCGINTMFNTGTVVGVGANIFGGGFPPTHIASFSWGGAEGIEEYKFDKMVETANRVYARRSLTMSAEEKQILQTVFDRTKKDRK
jgi:UDP-N-acetylglucosamine diphosphorylase/glucosamine-1-phosphate N-acetyltransferase